ncbi:molybdopterin cofactor-binding domain-containing protein [Sorangium sp. So ce861]|uniref:xanthine dehydrogenase family protein molybdopterin-binding subunit n=1 Tax=Sorangium sp. So ce861 TaxID=3133323 RepID=UPI003F62B512
MTVSRRDFLHVASASAAGLLLSFHVPERARAAPKAAPSPAQLPPPNAFVRVGPDESVTVLLAHSEMGQGIWTGLAMLIAEELDCEWSRVQSEHAPAAPVYAHPVFHAQLTGGSSSTNSEFLRYRTVGAMAKDMLVRAAAARWKVAPEACRAANGVVTRGKDQLTYGQVAADAMKLSPPTKVKLKDPKDWKLIGTRVRRLDTPEKISGKARFGIDVHFPGLRTAVVLHPPAFGAKLARFDPSAALQVPGVEKVVPVASGVAVVAAHFWAAKLGRDALRAEWTPPEGGGLDTAKLLAEFRALSRKTGAIAVDVGEVDAGLGAAKARLDLEYDVPYLAHAPMEPLGGTVKIDGDRCEIWVSTQSPGATQQSAAKILGVPPEKVDVHTTFLGGGFGRRGSQGVDFAPEAVMVAKAAGVPVKLVWTREDDIRGGYYRPMYAHRVQVGVDARGMPVAWDHVVVGQSIVGGTPLEPAFVKNGVDSTTVEGIVDSPYLEPIPARRVSAHSPKTPIPALWWRSVGHSHTAFVMESAIDELAHAAGQDPLAYRLALLKGKPRHARALELAADKAGWGKAPAEGRGRGLAVHESYGSIVAEVAEVSIDQGRIRVHEVTCAVDCGTAVNPLGVEAQLQSGVVFGLTAALYGKLTLVGGKVQESNFHDYPMLRMFEMPRIAVHILQSNAEMGGIGEPGTPPIAPAVANAVFALTKRRLRSLPLRVG